MFEKCPNCSFEIPITVNYNKEKEGETMSSQRRLSEINTEQMGTVIRLDINNKNVLKKLISMGVLPGMSVKMLQKFPSYLLQVGNTQLAIDKKIAETIYVKIIV